MTVKRPKGMIRLDSGTPSFPTPAHICQAAKDALDAGHTFYAPGYGEPEFLQAVCETVRRETDAEYTPDEVFATNGASSGIYTVMTSFLDPGDEVILMDPTFSLYAHVVEQLGAVPLYVA
ncbi:MAG: aminotransferase class I/II-fold pyridoxal phosphate-dependent enzyme, partial [bacterium]